MFTEVLEYVQNYSTSVNRPGRDEIETPYSRTSVNRPGRDEIETPYSRTKGQSKMDNPEKLAI
jgi:hypothetical protein